MLNFKTKCINCDISTTFAPLGSSWVSKEAENFKVLTFFSLGCYFSAKIEQTSKKHPKMAFFSSFWLNLDDFEDSSILTEKQWLKNKNSCSLRVSASFDTLLDPGGTKVVK